MKSIFYSAITIAGKSIGAGFTFKRNMFTKGGNIKNLKKSGDLISTTGNESVIKIGGNISVTSKLKSLDLANHIAKQQEQYIIEQTSSSTTTVALKDISTGIISPRNVNRYLATYGKINKNYIVNIKEDELKINTNAFIKYKATRIAEEVLKQKKMSKDQFLVFVKRLNAIDLSYMHATICDIIKNSIEENEEYFTIIYHVITTKPTIVDYGGPNRFKPIFLYHNKEANLEYYTIPLTYLQKLKKKDYIKFYVLKNKEAFKNDTEEVQNDLAYNIKRVSEINTFQMLDVNEKCLNIILSEIISDEIFPDSIYSKNITCYVPFIPYLFD